MDTIEQLEETQRSLSEAIGEAKKTGNDAGPLIERHREIGRKIDQLRPEEPDDEQGGDRLTTEVISDTERFAQMQEEWDGLVQRSDGCSPFVLWEWLYPWWQTYGEGRKLMLVVARRAQKLIGVAPLMWGLRRGRRIDKSALGFVGTSERVVGDYFDLIVDREHEPEIRRVLLEEMYGLLHEAALGELQLMAVGESMTDTVEALSRQGLEILVRPCRNSVVARLPDSFEEFVASVPNARRRSYLRNQEDTLRERFCSVEYQTAQTEDEMERMLAALSRFSRERLSTDGTTSAWEDHGFCDCMRRICHAFMGRGAMRLDCLRLDGEMAAVLMGFVSNGAYCLYQLSFDDGLADARPGHCLIGHRIRESIRDGLSVFDFLAGEHRYKTTYSDERRRLADLVVFRPEAGPRRRVGLALVGQACKGNIKSLLGRWHARR